MLRIGGPGVGAIKKSIETQSNYVTFEVDPRSHVFFDNVNKKICTVRSNGAMGITAKGLKDDEVITFRTRDAGIINSLNFSTDALIAGIHRRDSNSVDFVFLDDRTQNVDQMQDYSQKCKNEKSKIYGLEWINDKQIIYITDHGIELYQFNPKKKSVKLVRNESFETSWYFYYPPSQLMICSSGVACDILNLFVIQNGVIHKLPKFEVDFGLSSKKTKLNNKDITIASIYGKLYILVLKYDRTDGTIEGINLYLLNNDANEPPKLAHVLLIGLGGPINVHVIDNVVVAHHMTSTQSLLFDIRLSNPAVEIRSFASTTITIDPSLRSSVYDADNIALYKQMWAIFAPNFVADARFGIFGQLLLDNEMSEEFIEDKMILLEYIENRSNSREMFLNILTKLLASKSLTIRQSSEVFQRVVEIPGTARITTKEPNYRFRLITEPFRQLRVDYNVIVQSVLFNLREGNTCDMHFLAAVALEFLLVLKRASCPMDLDLLTDLLLHALIDAGEFSKLKQLLQYRVFDDLKLLPHDLLELGKQYQDFDQIAVDILRRQGKFRQIAEHRLDQRRPIDALRCMRDQKIDLPLCLRFLETAWETGCRQTKYTVYTVLKDMRRLAFFDVQNDKLDKYTREFKLLFNEEELEEAERRFRLAAIGGSSASISNRRDSQDLDESVDCSSIHSEEQLDLYIRAPGEGNATK